MTTTVNQNTVTFAYSAPDQDKLISVLDNAAEFFYPGNRLHDNNNPPRPIPYSALTNAQKLQILDKCVRAYVVSAAERNRDRKAANIAASSDDQSLE